MSDQSERDQWPGMLKAEFNRYVADGPEYTAWFNTLKQKLGRVDDKELCNAISMAAEGEWAPKHTNNHPIVAKLVAAWVRRVWGIKKADDAALNRKLEIRRIKAEIDVAGTPDDIWYLICSATVARDCDVLEKYALQSRQFHRKDASKEATGTNLLRDLKKLQEETGSEGVMRNVKDLIKPTEEEMKRGR